MIKVLSKRRTHESITDVYTLDVNGKEVEAIYWSTDREDEIPENGLDIEQEDLLTEEEIDEINDLEWWDEYHNEYEEVACENCHKNKAIKREALCKECLGI